MDRRKWALKGLRDGIPIALGYIAVGFTIGIAARNVSITALQSFFMSLGMVASAGEYAAVLLIGSAAGALEIIATTLVINLRYFLMSCSLSQKLAPDVPLWKRFLLAYCVTDELFGISSAVEGYLEPVYTYCAAVVAVAGWCAGTVAGVLAGNVLPPRLSSAMNVALYGMFLAIIIPSARKSRFMAVLIALSMFASWLLSVLPVLSSLSEGFRIILLTVIIAGAAAFIRPIKEEA